MINILDEYQRNLQFFEKAGIIHHLPGCGKSGVTGIDGIEYPFPSFTEIYDIISDQKGVVVLKSEQNFTELLIVPMALPMEKLIAHAERLIIELSQKKILFEQEGSLSTLISRTDKPVWPWAGLLKVVNTDELIYFPVDCHSFHCGIKKREVIHSPIFCPVPGWSVSLVQPDAGDNVQQHLHLFEFRKGMLPGASPKEYFQQLQLPDFTRESGFTIEDALIFFLQYLMGRDTIPFKRQTRNATWLLGNYIPYDEQLGTDLIPTIWWHSDYGRLRLDAHRPGNSKCTIEWGCKTLVRLQAPILKDLI